MIHLSHNPDKLEAKALDYERKGKTNKAIKCREKAARLRASHGGGASSTATITGPDRNHDGIPDQLQVGGHVRPVGSTLPPGYAPRTPAMYEANALKWEQRGNWQKAQKNREKVWRQRNPQYATGPAPVFYQNNSFLGYNVPPSTVSMLPSVHAPLGGQVLTDYNRDGIPDQFQRGGAGGLVGGVSTTTITGPDRNHDGIPDQLQRGGLPPHGLTPLGGQVLTDYNRDGIPDQFQRGGAGGLPLGGQVLTDYNRDGIPDQFQRGGAGGLPLGGQVLTDYNRDGIPDQFQRGGAGGFPQQGQVLTDYNRDGIPDQFQRGGAGGFPLGGGYKKTRDANALEVKAAEYERRGKTAKAQKLRSKAQRVRAGNYTSSRTPDMYERNALKWEKRGNWDKAQKNRSKAWRHKYPQYAQHTGPSFYNNNSFLGYDVPFTASNSTLLPYYRTTSTTTSYGTSGAQYGNLPGATYGGVPLGGGGFHGLSSRDPTKLEERAFKAERKGKTQKAMKLRQKAAKIRSGQHSGRSIQQIEAKALRYEQQGNWKRAQKTRAKAWRLHNPQYISAPSAPIFYNNNAFLGYNVPYTGMSSYSSVSGVTSGMGHLGIGTQTVYAAAIVEQVVRPTIVTETQRAERIVEVQPIIHREIDAPQLRVVEKHVYETVPSVGPTTVTNTAIVHETVTPRITEELQSIVHREVPAPFIERVEQHVTEHIVQPVVQTKEVIQDTHVHIAAGAPLLGGIGGVQHVVTGGSVPMTSITGTDFNRDGIPDQLQGGVGGGFVGGVHHQGGMVGGVYGVPTATISGSDLNRDGIPDQLQRGGVSSTATISGPDRNHDGIPDQLQGGRRI